MDSNNLPIIYIGGDHASYKIRETIEKHLFNSGYTVFNVGCHSTAPANYATYAIKVATKVHDSNAKAFGIVICGSGIGVNIATNKVKGIKSSLVYSTNMAINARENRIPCVVGIKDVTSIIRTGENVLLNGDTGEVII